MSQSPNVKKTEFERFPSIFYSVNNSDQRSLKCTSAFFRADDYNVSKTEASNRNSIIHIDFSGLKTFFLCRKNSHNGSTSTEQLYALQNEGRNIKKISKKFCVMNEMSHHNI